MAQSEVKSLTAADAVLVVFVVPPLNSRDSTSAGSR